jgi:oligoendopeptidase F
MGHRAYRFAVLFPLAIGALAALAQEGPQADAAAADWDLSDLYPSADAWKAAFADAHSAAESLGSGKGTLGKDAASMLAALGKISDLRQRTARLLVYANLQGDEDLRVPAPQERRQQAQALSTLIDANTAWVAPEIVSIGSDRVDAFLASNPALRERFDFYLHDTLRAAGHTLGAEAEGVLANSGDLQAQPNNVFQQLTQAELPFPTITLSNGQKARLDSAAYSKYRSSPVRTDRKAVFDSYWTAWKGFEGTLGANLSTQVMSDAFVAKSRRFQGSLDAALFGDNMPPQVYRTLVSETNAALPTLHRYLRLRKQVLGITEPLTYYDNYPSLFPATSVPKFDVEQSKRLTLAALAPMGEEYLGLLRRGFAGRWMNPYPHQGKASGAYMNGSAYQVHPYLLLNHTDDYLSLSTLAHEWGHAVHTQLADAAQPFDKSNYSTFIAESASIGNEMLLNDYMVEHAGSPAERLYYLGQALESMRQTFFRQVQFAEFQLQMHQELERGEALSGARLTQEYCAVLRRYYGEADGVMTIDPLYCHEWESVPHFYYGFYVYQYATSMAGAALFTDAILKEGAPARDRFLNMLKAGGSDYAYELYRRAGIDMATPAPYRALFDRMNRIMDEIEALRSQAPTGSSSKR